MDLQEFSAEMLYFQEEIDPEIEALVNEAAAKYGPKSEFLLMRALALDEDNLVVLIGLYRYYYYQNQYVDCLSVAYRVMAVVGKRIEFPARWPEIEMVNVVNALTHSFCLVRLYFFALKAAGYVQLRMSRFEEGRAMLEKVVAMDSEDRMGAKVLLDVLEEHTAEVVQFDTAVETSIKKQEAY